MSSDQTSRTVLPAIVADICCVVLFAAIGRSSHSEDVSPAGVFITAWPFLVGLAVAWIASLAWRAPLRPLRSGVPIWIGTVLIGMLVRWATGDGTALAFVIVATVALGILLVGWRGIGRAVAAIRGRRAALRA